jgi:stage II sporulation protein AB (anti-sigma F factor)
MNNRIKIEMQSKPVNESFARSAVSAFIAPLDPTLEELADVRTAVSEAVTNSIIHGYAMGDGVITLEMCICGDLLTVEIKDRGRGIKDIEQAMQPYFTTGPEGERSGMGFAVMKAFMDKVEVFSKPAEGTVVRLIKRISSADA